LWGSFIYADANFEPVFSCHVSKADSSRSRRSIPAVEKILQALGELDLPRPIVVNVVRRELTELRSADAVPAFEAVIDLIRSRLDTLRLGRIQPVINGTGILIHTNLGRAPLAQHVVEKLLAVAGNYNNLEYDLATGERGARAANLESSLALLCGAPAATVVNNCAAALVLILRHFTSSSRKEVIISRGELVQIGGGFRIPNILEASGARLREIGTTNKTELNDYERAIDTNTALILKVHQSNFFMDGFVDAPSTERIAELAREKQIPFVEDLGSGAMAPTENIPGVEHEPTAQEVLGRGVDLVCFSGDKLLGGPQAGIIVGQARFVEALKQEPFFRALRCDKLILAALEATVDLYLTQSSSGEIEIPILEMMKVSSDMLKLRADSIRKALANLPLQIEIGKGESQIGGGTLPRSVLSSIALEIVPKTIGLGEFAARLRRHVPPIIGYISGGCFKLDLRTVFAQQDAEVVHAIQELFTKC
jgi:L-seryl-tRNA(Ser) seleniumtransferase